MVPQKLILFATAFAIVIAQDPSTTNGTAPPGDSGSEPANLDGIPLCDLACFKQVGIGLNCTSESKVCFCDVKFQTAAKACIDARCNSADQQRARDDLNRLCDTGPTANGTDAAPPSSPPDNSTGRSNSDSPSHSGPKQLANAAPGGNLAFGTRNSIAACLVVCVALGTALL